LLIYLIRVNDDELDVENLVVANTVSKIKVRPKRKTKRRS